MELGIEIVAISTLCMVNLKNAIWQLADERHEGLRLPHRAPYWTTGSDGLASWPRVIKELNRRLYNGVICLTAEYSDEGPG